MFYRDLPFDLDVTRHDAVFNPKTFNPRLVALVGSAKYVVPLFHVLVRLGLQRFAIYCNDDLSGVVRSAKIGLEEKNVHELEVHTDRMSVEAALAGPKAEVVFVVHESYVLTSLLAHFLSNPLAAEAIFVPYWEADGLRIVSLPTTDGNLHRSGYLPSPGPGANYQAIAGLNFIVAGFLAFAFLAWHVKAEEGVTRFLPPFRPVMTTALSHLKPSDTSNCVDRNTPIDVVGLGALGSWIVYLLLKEGFRKVRGFDFDVVDKHNLPNQFFHRRQIRSKAELPGTNKANALAQVLSIEGLTGFVPVARKADFASDSFASVVVLATDRMSERAELYRRKDLGATQLIVDARISVGTGSVRSAYRKNLGARSLYAEALARANHNWEDGGPRGACRQPTLAPLGLIIAGLVLNHLFRLLPLVSAGRLPAEQGSEIITSVNFLWILENRIGGGEGEETFC